MWWISAALAQPRWVLPPGQAPEPWEQAWTQIVAVDGPPASEVREVEVAPVGQMWSVTINADGSRRPVGVVAPATTPGDRSEICYLVRAAARSRPPVGLDDLLVGEAPSQPVAPPRPRPAVRSTVLVPPPAPPAPPADTEPQVEPPVEVAVVAPTTRKGLVVGVGAGLQPPSETFGSQALSVWLASGRDVGRWRLGGALGVAYERQHYSVEGGSLQMEGWPVEASAVGSRRVGPLRLEARAGIVWSQGGFLSPLRPLFGVRAQGAARPRRVAPWVGAALIGPERYAVSRAALDGYWAQAPAIPPSEGRVAPLQMSAGVALRLAGGA